MAGKAFLDMFGVFAEFETNLRRERQLEGIGAAKTRLRWEEKLGPAAIARPLGIARSSVYLLLDKHRAAAAANGDGDADQA